MPNRVVNRYAFTQLKILHTTVGTSVPIKNLDKLYTQVSQNNVILSS
jgi:hypothetical protein